LLGSEDRAALAALPAGELWELECYRELFGRVTVVEVTGRVDFTELAPVVDELLSRVGSRPAPASSSKIYSSVIVP
jgi:hypothetical protein